MTTRMKPNKDRSAPLPPSPSRVKQTRMDRLVQMTILYAFYRWLIQRTQIPAGPLYSIDWPGSSEWQLDTWRDDASAPL